MASDIKEMPEDNLEGGDQSSSESAEENSPVPSAATRNVSTSEVKKQRILAFCNQLPRIFEDVAIQKYCKEKQVALWREKHFTDIVVKSRTTSILCHKLVLASASPYFFKKLTKTGELITKIEFRSMSSEILQEIMDYIYTGRAEITEDNVRDLFVASSEFELPNLSKACDDYMSDGIGPVNAIRMLMLAKNHGMKGSTMKAMNCLLQNPNDVLQFAQEEEFKMLDEDTLVEWISHDKLASSQTEESVLFQIVQRWVEADSSRNNEPCVKGVMIHVNLGKCAVPFLMKTIRNSRFMEYESFRQQFEDAKTYVLMKLAEELPSEQTNTCTTGNAQKPQLILFGGKVENQEESTSTPYFTFGRREINCNMNYWSFTKDRDIWHRLTKLPTLHPMNGCVLDNKLIIAGGSTYCGVPIPNAWQFCLSTNAWKTLPSLNHARSGHGIVAVGQSIFVIGGRFKNELRSVEILEEHQQWWVQSRSSLPCPMGHCHAFYTGQKIYAIGWKTFVMDMKERWTEKTPIPEDITGCSMALVGSKIYAVGGSANTFKFSGHGNAKPLNSYCYNIELDTWTKIRPSPVHIYGAAVEWQGGLLLMGGQTDSDSGRRTAVVDEYDPDKDRWLESTITLPCRLAHHTVLVNK